MADIDCQESMYSLISEKYLKEYTTFKNGVPNRGDAMWLCDNGINTEEKLRARIGMSNNNTLIIFIIIIILYFWLKR